MTISKDVPILRYGTPDGHQSDQKPVKGSASLYAGTVVTTASGYVTGSNDAVASTDIVWGVFNGIVDSNPMVSSPVTAGTTDGSIVIGIDTGTFFLASGTNSDALTQADVGATVYLIDKVTVGKTNGGSTRPVAGKLIAVDTTQTPSYAVRLGNNQSSGDV